MHQQPTWENGTPFACGNQGKFAQDKLLASYSIISHGLDAGGEAAQDVAATARPMVFPCGFDFLASLSWSLTKRDPMPQNASAYKGV